MCSALLSSSKLTKISHYVFVFSFTILILDNRDMVVLYIL